MIPAPTPRTPPTPPTPLAFPASPSLQPGRRLHRYPRAADLVRSMAEANRVASTHIRLVVAHTLDQRGSLEALLEHDVLRDVVGLDITGEAWTVDALACDLLGTGFHALTFSLRPNPHRGVPTRSTLTAVEPGRLSRSARAPFRDIRWGIFDTARLPTSVFDGTSRYEFLVQLPAGVASPADPADTGGSLANGGRRGRTGRGATDGDRVHPALCFRQVASHVAGLAVRHERPLFFAHGPSAMPSEARAPEDMRRTGLRFAASFRHPDDAGRLHFGKDLVDLCSREGYGLWQRATSAGDHTHDYWELVVPVGPPPAGDAGSADRSAGHPAGVSVDHAAGHQASLPAGASSGHQSGHRAGHPTGPAERRLALTCVGPARVGVTQGLLDILTAADAPLHGVSTLTLDDIAIVHVLTHLPVGRSAGADLPADLRADLALSRVLGLDPPMRRETLRDCRLVVSPRARQPADPGLAALWLAWQAPATPDALRLTLDTLQAALDDAWARHHAGSECEPRSGHLNIEYIACRNTTSSDRLQGRMQVAIDLHAFGPAPDDDHDDAHRSAETGGPDPRPVSAARLGRFCHDVEHNWREALSLALNTPYVEADVVWRESWLTPTPPTHI